MEQQMNTILLLLIFTGLVGMLLVIFFMLDRLNELHRHADIPKGHIDPASSFGGLTGKNLWDAMIGIPMPGWEPKQVAAIRPRYELVLQKHLELLFEDGKLDGREGLSMPVRCDRKVATLRGEIESWIPHEFASGVYKAGYAFATAADGDRETVARQLDMLGQAIFSAAGLPQQKLSAILMPLVERPGADDPEAEDDTDTDTDTAASAEQDSAPPEGGEPPALPMPDSPATLPVDLPHAAEPAALADDSANAETAAEAIAAAAPPATDTAANSAANVTDGDTDKRQEIAAQPAGNTA